MHQTAARVSRLPPGVLRRAASTVPWYRQEISTIVPVMEETSPTIDELRKLMDVPKGRTIVASEMNAQGRSSGTADYVPLAQRKLQDRVWTRLQRVLADVEGKGSNMATLSDAYTATFQALSRANMPYESLEALLRHMQSRHIPVSTGVHIAMLHQARGNSIVQVLRKLSAGRAASVLLDGATPELLPTDIQSLHYVAYDSFIKTLHTRYMESTTSVFPLSNYVDLYLAIVGALPPMDIKIMERTISTERLDKLAVASVRAPAMCGLCDAVLDRLDILRDEYAGRSATVPSIVFEAAIEGFAALQHELMNVPESTLNLLRKTPEVMSSPRVMAVRDIATALNEPLLQNRRILQEMKSSEPSKKDLALATSTASTFRAAMKKLAGYLRKKEALHLVARDALGAADAFVADIREMYEASGHVDPMPLQVALATQYFVAASRFDRRVSSAAFQDELVFRVFRTLDEVAATMDDTQEAQVLEILKYSYRTCVLLFRVSEAMMVLDMKETLFPHVARSIDDYNDLLMALCANRKTRFAQLLQILQRMHNQGLAPTPLTIHRLVTFRMHQLNDSRPSRKMNMNHAKEEAMRDLAVQWKIPVPPAKPHPLVLYTAEDDIGSIGDVVSFVIDWHNMTGVVPYGKTLKLVVDYCVEQQADATIVHELQRLLQWAAHVPLEPATRVYLEHLTIE
ncbi:unnamed protein product [Aphanomyces euteiches]|uniref:Pentacotripeptide-repeat region of PRORP domain-containing protein n=1 Tax=Aphanomyces euteiches TaxID=100861 RepID=A0A6G0XV30_9STRA|nr:hypothetical protein Ae201684_000797 [Aphanomyces euteiches]KAH9135655.1 hypothetical protein AeRB84_018991 [Aphanomyces euteiches]